MNKQSINIFCFCACVCMYVYIVCVCLCMCTHVIELKWRKIALVSFPLLRRQAYILRPNAYAETLIEKTDEIHSLTSILTQNYTPGFMQRCFSMQDKRKTIESGCTIPCQISHIVVWFDNELRGRDPSLLEPIVVSSVPRKAEGSLKLRFRCWPEGKLFQYR